MLNQTFCHIPCIGHVTERRLWQLGLCCWNDLLHTKLQIPRVNHAEIVKILEDSRIALTNDPNFFTSRLASHDSWRIFPHFRHQTAYLDIETNGLGDGCEITAIALYDGNTVRSYVSGRNLDAFPDEVDAYDVLVSYNGRSFDIPVIERFFRIRLRQAQIDLRYVLARLGGRGGLKGCERQFGINRGLLDGIDGSAAVLLWREYERHGNKKALETLLAYNIEDTVNLERLLVEAYNRHLEKTPFASDHMLPYPQPPPVCFQADPSIVQQMRQ